jgi:hypothetical protein
MICKEVNDVVKPTIENEGYVTSINVNSYEIRGTGEPNSTIHIKMIDRNKKSIIEEETVSSDGKYSIINDLSSFADGYFTIEVFPNNDPAYFATKKIIKDTIGPFSEIHTTDDVTQVSMASYRIEGKTEPFSEVSISIKDINNESVITLTEADLSGMFASTLNLTPLIEGELTIEVSSKDKLGNRGTIAEQKITKTTSIYILTLQEQQRWNISNNGTSPIETTKGFNDALVWASQNNYETFIVPAGTYLIRKGEPYDPAARINMVSNMTFLLEDGAILQKETNGKEHYDLLYIASDVQNVNLRGGIYRGDKDTHDYSQRDNPYSVGTHESGCGIRLEGAKNIIIEDIVSEKFTGDGLTISGTGQLINEFYKESFESGGIDDSGQLIADSTKIRIRQISKMNFNNPIFNKIRTIQLSNPQKLSKSIPYDLFFYQEDGQFLTSVKNRRIGWDLIEVPQKAYYFIAVLHSPIIPTGVYIEFWVKAVSRDIVVKNSKFAFSRRQGITVGGAEDVLITNNLIHDIKGIAPQSGIDVEGGVGENGYANKKIYIKENKLFNNHSYDLILFDGQEAVVEGNYFGSVGTIGLAISSPFTGAYVKDNTFDGTRIVAYHDATFINNNMNDSYTFFEGPNININGMKFIDSRFSITSKIPFGVKASNIEMINNKKTDSGLTLWGKPVHLTDITIKGESTLRSLTGQLEEGSIFDNLEITGYNSTYGLDLPQGIYNNCTFESFDGSRFGSLSINKSGKFIFNHCSFISNQNGSINLLVNHIHSEVIVRESIFEVLSNAPAISVQTTKNIKIDSNIINANKLTSTATEIIKINDYWQRNNPYDVLAASIENNTITTNLSAKGISTIYAGTGAPPYYIKNNVLYNAKLQLKANDENENNQELTK